ncbi:hypothetical protein [Sporosarcina sp. FSL W7-1283]|uniref:hypothetical protein n=1 Tax=Sporosarcina sp. FSL W7-1283 TaxID=2921560 RepID=UPI0030F5D951
MKKDFIIKNTNIVIKEVPTIINDYGYFYSSEVTDNVLELAKKIHKGELPNGVAYEEHYGDSLNARENSLWNEKAENFLKQFGIAVTDIQGNYRNPVEVLLDIKDVSSKLSEHRKDIVKQFFT